MWGYIKKYYDKKTNPVLSSLHTYYMCLIVTLLTYPYSSYPNVIKYSSLSKEFLISIISLASVVVFSLYTTVITHHYLFVAWNNFY